MWTFVLLFFHAHSFDTIPHGDFGAGVGHSHGPHAMMQQQQIAKIIDPTNADASAALPNSAEKRQTSADNKQLDTEGIDSRAVDKAADVSEISIKNPVANDGTQ